jgi:hypothetical protein
MLQLFATHAYWQAFLLAAFALSLVLTCRGLLRLVVGSQHVRAWSEAVFALAAIVVTGVLATDAARLVERRLGVELAPIPAIVTLALALASVWLHLRSSALRLPVAELVAQPLAWGALVWGVAAAGWSGTRFYATAAVAADPVAAPRSEPRLLKEPAFVGITDRGREIRLFRLEQPTSGETSEKPATRALASRPRNTILRADRDHQSNCHGWVFTSGRFLLNHIGVRRILEDNGYQPCFDPRPGDVIVYHVGDGRIVHTGLVSGILYDGTIMIESKWDLGARLLHRPEDQPYSSRYTYYRTPRSSHAIIIRPRGSYTTLQTSSPESPDGP